MAWKSGSHTMPRDAGGPRAGGNRIQMPNWMRVAVPGGEAIAFVGDVSLAIAGGATATIPGGVFASLGGSIALATTATHYISYATVAAPAVLLACRQQDFAAIYAAADVVAIGYHTDHFDIRMPQAIAAAVGLPGGLGRGQSPTFAAHFDNNSVLSSILVGNAYADAISPPNRVFFGPSYVPIPGPAPGVYDLYVDLFGNLSFSVAPVGGAMRIATLTIQARPTANFDQPDFQSLGPSNPAMLFANGPTVAPTGGVAIPASAYRSDQLPRDGTYHYYNVSPPTDGVGGYFTVYDLVTQVAFPANKTSAIANSPMWADPLCGLHLYADAGNAGFGVNAASPPYAQLMGMGGDVPMAPVYLQTLAGWQSYFNSNGPIVYGRSYLPQAYLGTWFKDGFWRGASQYWVMHPGAFVTQLYYSP